MPRLCRHHHVAASVSPVSKMRPPLHQPPPTWTDPESLAKSDFNGAEASTSNSALVNSGPSSKEIAQHAHLLVEYQAVSHVPNPTAVAGQPWLTSGSQSGPYSPVPPLADQSSVTSAAAHENPNASAYLNKRIENWEEICTLVAVDRAIGDGAEQHEESAAAQQAENEGAGISEMSGESSSKRLKRDRLADAVSSFADSFKKYVESRMPPKFDSRELYDIVSTVLGLSRDQVLKATKRFLSNSEEFEMLKILPEQDRLDWILLCIE